MKSLRGLFGSLVNRFKSGDAAAVKSSVAPVDGARNDSSNAVRLLPSEESLVAFRDVEFQLFGEAIRDRDLGRISWFEERYKDHLKVALASDLGPYFQKTMDAFLLESVLAYREGLDLAYNTSPSRDILFNAVEVADKLWNPICRQLLSLGASPAANGYAALKETLSKERFLSVPFAHFSIRLETDHSQQKKAILTKMLTAAVTEGHNAACVKRILDAGVDPEDVGVGILTISTRPDVFRVLAPFLSRLPHYSDTLGMRLLQVVSGPASPDNEDFAHEIVRAGANISSQDYAVINAAVKRDYLRLVPFMLEHISYPNIISDPNIMSCLATAAACTAAERGNVKMISVLELFKPDFDKVFEVARRAIGFGGRYEDVANYLLTRGSETARAVTMEANAAIAGAIAAAKNPSSHPEQSGPV